MLKDIELVGHQKVAGVFLQLPRETKLGVRSRVLRKAAKTIVVPAARSVVPPHSRTGMWRESIGVKLWPDSASRDTFNVVLAIVGSRRGVQYDSRANIAHLLEHGWRTVRPGSGTLERGDSKAAMRSSVTGEAGRGTQAGRVEGYQVFRKAAALSAGPVQEMMREGVIKEAKRAWDKLRKGVPGA